MIIGPTASGKSALALELAKRQPSVIINADSAQVYADLNVLSARPSEAEMASISHRLYGYIDGGEACSAARWAADAKREINQAHSAGRLPILVGGTGLYVRTLLDGISPIPEIDPDVRAAVRKLDSLEAYKALLQYDPVAANRLNASDTHRVQRALEVVQSSGKPLDYWYTRTTGGIADQIDLMPLVLLPPREWLYDRCNSRFVQMLEHGAISEVETLLARKLASDPPVMRAIGVPELRALLEGQSDRKTVIEQAQIATRRYAKRQYTWFRNQCPATWPRYEEAINNDNINNIVTLFQ